MTREQEAITYFEGMKKRLKDFRKMYPSTDTVGYQATTKEISFYDMSISALSENKAEWIPVSERLPEKDESVLLTICANSSLYGFNENFVKVMCGSYSPCGDKRDWIVNEIRYYIDNVIAWMPLPEPYKPEKGGE